jgi:protein TonB
MRNFPFFSQGLWRQANLALKPGAAALRPVWLRPVALFGILGFHALVLAARGVAPETPSPMTAIEVSLAPMGDDSAANQTRLDEIAPAAPAAEALREAVAPPSEPPKVVAPEAEPLPVEKPKPEVATTPAPNRAARERQKRKAQKIADERLQAQQARLAARRGSSTSRAASGAARANYAGLLMAELNRHRFYPGAARAAGVAGSVGVAFTVGPSGRVTSQAITRSSGVAALDAAARTILTFIHAPPPPGGSFYASTSINFHLD